MNRHAPDRLRRWLHRIAAAMTAAQLLTGPFYPGGVPGGPMMLCKDGTVRPAQNCPK